MRHPNHLRSTVLAPFAIFLLSNCIAVLGVVGKGERDDRSTWFAVLLGLGGARAAGAALSVSGPPTLVVSEAMNFPADALQVEQSPAAVPGQLNGAFVPAGHIYDIGLEGTMSKFPYGLVFPNGQVELKYSYNREALKAAGLTEEFAVFYYDAFSEEWMPVNSVSVDVAAASVSAFTDHMTPFLIAAVPASAGTVAEPTSCITTDFPSGIGGSAGARFTTVDGGFRYLADRDYYIVQDQNFADLGFSQALGVATCNGDSACGTFAQHKLNTGSDYVVFDAHANIDVYLMYDTRGAVDLNDATQDAPWIAAAGFANTGRFIRTTDPVGRFRVYKKSYQKGQTVRLDGNRRGVTAPGIQSNYWLVIKRQGVGGVDLPASICEAARPSLSSLSVSNLRGIPGADRVTLLWQNADDPQFSGTLIRRSRIAPPSLPTDGTAASGTTLSPHAFRDEGLAVKEIYYYTIFAYDQDGRFHKGASVTVKTGTDTDGDGLADSYETATIHPTTQTTNTALADTDGDGISDGDEVAAGTDPTNPDTTPPTVSILLKSETITNDPVVLYEPDGTDNIGITGWLVTRSATPPPPYASTWQATKPSAQTLLKSGVYNFHAWARDAAGNVSAAVAPVSVNLEGINVAKFVYTADGDGPYHMHAYQIDSGTLTHAQTISGVLIYDFAVDEKNNFLYVLETAGVHGVGVFGIDPVTGALARVQDPVYNSIGFPGRRLVLNRRRRVLHSADITDAGGGAYSAGLRTYAINPSDGRISGVSTVSGELFSADPYHVLLYRTGASRPWVSSTGEYVVTPTWGANTENYAQALRLDAQHNASAIGAPISRGGTGFFVYPGQGMAYVHQGYGVWQALVADGSGAYASSWSGSPGGCVPADLAFSPDGRFAYAICMSDSIQIYRVAAGGALTYLATQSVAGASNIQVTQGRAFVMAAGASPGQLLLFARDTKTGLLSLLDNTGSIALPVAALGIYNQHDGNDPPVADAGPERWHRFNSGPVALQGHGSGDPDAYLCDANPANYAIAWKFVSVPAGSGLNDTAIVNRSTLTSASFTPDVTGDYVLQLTFTDHPGTCAGTAKTVSATTKIKVGYYHTQPGDYLNTIGAAAAAGADWNETVTKVIDYGHDHMLSFVRKDYLGDYANCYAVSYLSKLVCENFSNACGPVAFVCHRGCGIIFEHMKDACRDRFIGKYDFMHSCTSPYLLKSDATAYCEARPLQYQTGSAVTTELARGHTFQLVTRDLRHIGYWSWWTYN